MLLDKGRLKEWEEKNDGRWTTTRETTSRDRRERSRGIDCGRIHRLTDTSSRRTAAPLLLLLHPYVFLDVSEIFREWKIHAFPRRDKRERADRARTFDHVREARNGGRSPNRRVMRSDTAKMTGERRETRVREQSARRHGTAPFSRPAAIRIE